MGALSKVALIQIKRGTRAEVEAAKGSSGLNQGELYLITDESILAVGTAADDYVDVGPLGGGGSGLPDGLTWDDSWTESYATQLTGPSLNFDSSIWDSDYQSYLQFYDRSAISELIRIMGIRLISVADYGDAYVGTLINDGIEAVTASLEARHMAGNKFASLQIQADATEGKITLFTDKFIIGSGPGAAIRSGTYTPNIDNLNIGSTGNFNSCEYTFNGGIATGDKGLLFLSGQITLGTGAVMGTSPSIALPSGFNIDLRVNSEHAVIPGHVTMLVGGSSVGYMGLCQYFSQNRIQFTAQNGATPPRISSITATNPDTWTAGDDIYYNVVFPAVRV